MPKTTKFTTPDGVKIIIDVHLDAEDGFNICHFEATFSLPGMDACQIHSSHAGLAGIELEGEFSREVEWP